MPRTAAAKASEKRRRARQNQEQKIGIISHTALAGPSGGKGAGPFRAVAPPEVSAMRRALGTGDLPQALGVMRGCPDGQWDADTCAALMQRCCQEPDIGGLRLVLHCMWRHQIALPLNHFKACLSTVSQRVDPEPFMQWLAEAEDLVDYSAAADSRHLSQEAIEQRRRYGRHFHRLLLHDFLEEAAECMNRIRSMPARELERQGLALDGLLAEPFGGGGTLCLTNPRRLQACAAPPGTLQRGDSVILIPRGYGHHLPELEGEVTQLFPKMTVRVGGAASSAPLPRSMLPPGVEWYCCKTANRVTFTRQLDAIRQLIEAGGANYSGQQRIGKRAPGPDAVLADAILAAGISGEPPAVPLEQLLAVGAQRTVRRQAAAEALRHAAQEGRLNPSQYAAAEATFARRLTLIHGPPGTGKTHTTVALVRQWVAGGLGPVLAASDSNTAVDNMVDGLARHGVRVVRIGRPEAIRQDLNQYTLDQVVEALGPLGPDRDAQFLAQQQCLRQADVVACTCAGAGADILERFIFPSVIVDEAAQATEPSVLVPLTHGASQLVLVGDHCQLPATVLSREAELGGLGVSLFDRLVAGGARPFLLDTQYRMHPAMAAFPSQAYYNGMVRSGVTGADRPPASGFLWPQKDLPVAFVGVPEGREQTEAQGSRSFYNEVEGRMVAQCVDSFVAAGFDPGEIGVITPYAAQVRLLRRLLQHHRTGATSSADMRARGINSGPQADAVPGAMGFLEVNSVDGFQGREKEVIVVSAVRSAGLGFLTDKRRMNVTLTRGRRGIVVFGNPSVLLQDREAWGPWIAWAQRHGLMQGNERCGDPARIARLREIAYPPPDRAPRRRQPSSSRSRSRSRERRRSASPNWQKRRRSLSADCAGKRPRGGGAAPQHAPWADPSMELAGATPLPAAGGPPPRVVQARRVPVLPPAAARPAGAPMRGPTVRVTY
eukprot:TRINITY_DN856_c0_g1_i1.p1 TRINITY_DN856_c0_g1~~TRINITY_DN856_c0_g1_i1.p1  ORF type:complete len:976 (+),score=282.90 TRINITY_DN856_c0_g1_i1:97-2928(+)